MHTKSDKSSLRGLRVLAGRARHQASALSSGLRALGAVVIEIPFIEIRKPRSHSALDAALNNLQDYDWLILTSVNGVEAVWDRVQNLGLSKRELSHLKIAAIGPATKKAIEDRGLKVRLVPEQYVAESVVASLRKRVKGKRVLLARAKVARDVIPHDLRKVGAHVDVVEAYETIIPRKSATRLRALLQDSKRRPDLITFTSSSTAKNFVELLGRSKRPAGSRKFLSGIQIASIGPVTSATLGELGLPADIEARQYNIPGLIAAIASRHSRK